jgi:ATP-dependent Clp protease ATP-binding subunit ClpC
VSPRHARQGVSLFERYSTASRLVIFSARAEAGNVGSGFIDTEHILLGVLRVDPKTLQLTAQPLSLHSVRNYAIRWHTPSEKLGSSLDLPISQDAVLVLDKAVSLADGHGCDFVRTEHLLLALTAITTSHAAAILQEAGISLGRLEEIVDALPRTEQQEGNSS